MGTEGLLPEISNDVKQYDYDRWLGCLFTDPSKRDQVMTLLAFNSEIARVRETVSEPMLGDIRLQWWREALEEIQKGQVRAHPVVQALAELNRVSPIDFHLMQEMIDMRSRDLDPAPIASEGELIVYADATGGNLHHLIYNALGGSGGSNEVEAVVRSGRAYALSGILRAIPFHAQNDLILLPTNLIERHSLDPVNLFKKEHVWSFKKIVEEVCDLAAKEYNEALDLCFDISKEIKPAVYCNALTSIYLKRLVKAGYEPADPGLNPGSLRKIIALFSYRQFG
ncbi:squalene/phytoene synthase family protein [Sneathiella limimaris]|uniref:squalene/phytoene synthase family protein n=1 Tax=Sneathiella limimaris TaxID=1964213 RepID=UPI00146CBD12|nr:squalene/phytoene synthase family protein [Sneathiella limimaris]